MNAPARSHHGTRPFAGPISRTEAGPKLTSSPRARRVPVSNQTRRVDAVVCVRLSSAVSSPPVAGCVRNQSVSPADARPRVAAPAASSPASAGPASAGPLVTPPPGARPSGTLPIRRLPNEAQHGIGQRGDAGPQRSVEEATGEFLAELEDARDEPRQSEDVALAVQCLACGRDDVRTARL